MTKHSENTDPSNSTKPVLANRLFKFRTFHNNEEMIFFGLGQSIPDGEVMQFTGLKDKNGKEIYEGDIIKGKTFSGKENISYVIYDNNFGCWQLQTVGNNSLSFPIKSFNKELEIIGNIFENVNLLTKVI